MNFTFSIYYVPLILSIIICAVIMFHSWRLRRDSHGIAFFFLALGCIIWAFCNIMEYGFNTLSTKTFWVSIEYIGIEMVIVAWFIVIANFTGQTKFTTRRSILLLCIIPIITVFLIWTNRYHGLMRRNITLDTSGPFSIIKKSYGIWFWVTFAYSNLLMISSSIMLMQRLIQPPKLRSSQILALMACALFPWVGNFLYVFNLLPAPWSRLDMTSTLLSVSGAIMAFGLFRLQIMEIVPIARDCILENLTDAILVIDKRNRVADYNPACRNMLKLNEIIIGQPVEEVLNPLAIRPELIAEIKNVQEEISFAFGNETKIYDLRILSLFKKKQKLCGRIFHFRDVTDKRLAEMHLEKTVVDLRRALTEVRTLSGLLPICSSCKKIRDDTGYWKDVETYISQHSTAEFSHGICPDCMQKLYQEQYETLVKKGKISAKSDKES